MSDGGNEAEWEERAKRNAPAHAAAEEEFFKMLECKHHSYTMDKVTGDCTCDQCGKVVIDCLGRVNG